MSYKSQEIAVVIPAFNEAKSIGNVVEGLLGLSYDDAQLVDTVVVCDNASTDGTGEIASKAGAEVCDEFRQGYGFACLRALDRLSLLPDSDPDIVVFVDGDSSVEPAELPIMLDEIIAGNDLVVGSRTVDMQEQDALGPHQQIGNNVASALIRWIWGVNVTDLGPFRAMRYRSLKLLNMQDQRFGWTVEMQVKAIQAKLRYAEVPVTTRKRIGKSKISGTLKGTMGAFFGIFGKVFHLYFRQARFQLRVRRMQAILKESLNSPHNPPL